MTLYHTLSHIAGTGTTGSAYGPSCPYFARMLHNRRITASSHFQDTRHIELDLGDSGLQYEPGACHLAFYLVIQVIIGRAFSC